VFKTLLTFCATGKITTTLNDELQTTNPAILFPPFSETV
jgi:hypothetical protein